MKQSSKVHWWSLELCYVLRTPWVKVVFAYVKYGKSLCLFVPFLCPNALHLWVIVSVWVVMLQVIVNCSHWLSLILIILLSRCRLLTKSRKKILPWEANSCTVTPEFSQILWKPKFRYHVHKSPPLPHTLSKLNPVHTFKSYYFDINFYIVLRSTSSFSNLSLFWKFSDQICAWISPFQ